MSLGEKLKSIREEAQLSLDELSAETKIQKKYLQRLEREEFEKLPPAVYIKGFIQKWSKSCGVNAEDLVLQFYRENKFLVHNFDNYTLSKYNRRIFTVNFKYVIAGFLLIVSLILLAYFYYNQTLVVNAPTIEILAPTALSSVTSEEHVFISGRINGADYVQIDDEEVKLTPEGIFEYSYLLQAGLNNIIIKVAGHNGQDVEVIRKVLKLDK